MATTSSSSGNNSHPAEEEDPHSAVPWQYEWKRPQWQQATATTTDNSTNKQQDVEGHCLCMTSAQVSVEELPQYNSNKDVYQLESLVLTVTVVSSPFCAHRDNERAGAAKQGDLLILEVTRQPGPQVEEKEEEEKADVDNQEASSQEIVLKKVLRWPGVALTEQQQPEEEEEHLTWRHHIPVWLGGLPRRHQIPETTGVLSACLCRRLLEKDPKTAAAMDALDTMTFLSLGMDPEVANNNNSSNSQKETTGESLSERDSDDNNKSLLPELVLACLCSDGSVHVYSPFQLLLDQQQQQQQQVIDPADVFSISMSTFLMGDYVFAQLQNNIWPLSQPKATVQLTVPLLKKKKQRGQRKSPGQDDDPSQEDDENDNSDEESSSSTTTKVSMWDKSVWDPTVDPFTAIYRTRDNVPTLCISAFDYLVIAGRGRRVRKNGHRQDKKNSRGGVEQLGGFLTILSLRHYSELRTLFLPFAPEHVSPFVWGGMQFLFVLGNLGVAVAIRVDISIHNTIVCGEEPSPAWRDPNEPLIPSVSSEQSLQSASSTISTNNNKKKKTRAFIHRFQILPILLPQSITDEEEALEVAVATLFGSSPFTSPPGLALVCPSPNKKQVLVMQRTLNSIDYYKPRDASLLFQGYRRSKERRLLAIGTAQENRHVARITLSKSGSSDDGEDESSSSLELLKRESIWCHLGQGWCLLGVSNRMYFICWEGATAARGAFVKELQPLVDDASSNKQNNIRGLVCGLLPLDPFKMEEALTNYSLGKNLVDDFALPFTQDSKNELKAKVGLEDDDAMDDTVAEAIRNISGPAFSSPESQHHSHREKSIRLLEQCPTWTQLDATKQNRIRLEGRVPMVTVRLQNQISDSFHLSLRRSCTENGVATPFYQILSWLSNKKDYFTAASVALDLLRDANTLQHLWRAFDRIDDDDERTKLEGLLDGIAPINERLPAVSDPNSDNNELRKSVLTQLADMTVGCLTRGGFCMSSTLEYFLQLDSNYNTCRTALVLVATATQTLSGDNETMLSVMGDGYSVPDDPDQHIWNILWPLRCLLQTGVSRNHLPMALALINAALPFELRGKQQHPMVNSMALCVSMTKLIIGSSPEAIELLLSLVDEQQKKRFWESLDHETQLELALILCDEKCPMLRQGEVRSWALHCLERCLRGDDVAGEGQVPTSWLQNMCSACLVNAHCDIGEIMGAQDNMAGEEAGYYSDGLEEHKQEIKVIREALTAGRGSGGLDFGLLIPALLQLEKCNVQWNDDSWVSTQSLLNAACNLTGRATAEEPMFAFDGLSLMKLCTVAGNVCAGANLVGGKNGLILECCSILMKDSGMAMEEAESFLRQDKLSVPKSEHSNESEKVADDFTLTRGHQQILWLLDQHVIQVRTFGEFDSTPMRGKVDPVEAARLCLRTWYSLSKAQLQATSAWLATWLRRQLGMEDNAASNKRLACAALTRVLVWSSCVLGEHLELESKFLVQLSQASWSLLESVPPTVADELLEQDIADGAASPSLKRASTSDGYIS